MQLKYVSTLCFFMGFTFANEPAKVYEEDSPDQSSEVIRKSRKSPEGNLSNVFSPSQFIYLRAAQQDPRSRRYYQQQQVDSENLLKLQGQLRKWNAALEEGQRYAESRPFTTRAWRVVHPKFVTEKTAVDESDSGVVEIQKSHKVKRENHENRTLQRRELIDLGGNYLRNPSAFYFESLKNADEAKANYHGGVQNTHDQDINALNSLLGKTPVAQLRGLQQLLHSHAVKVAPLRQQDHTPIKEHVDDIENPQTKPNIKVEPQPIVSHNLVHQLQNGQAHVQAQVILQRQPNLDDLQNQLNAVSQMQAHEAIAQAQQKAFENVKLQHEALALAKMQAEKIALAQIQSQNLALAHAQAEAQALAQAEAHAQSLAQAEAALIHENALRKAKEEEEAPQLNAEEKNEEVPNQKSQQQNLALKILHQAAEESKNKNAVIHARRQAQAYRELAAQQYTKQNGLVSLDNLPYVHVPEQTFSYPAQEATTYVQPHVLALTQQQEQQETPPSTHEHVEVQTYVQPSSELQEHYVTPEVNAVEQDDGEYNEYASKYSFGYRVRDYHSGADYGHEEAKEGKVIRGRYDVLLPDGRIQVVEYWADPSGYHAKVSYTNVAHHR